MHNPARTPRGFTLIELMVVISIVALLSTVIIRSLNDARVRARNTAAYASAVDVAKLVAQCDTAGGNVTSPNSTTVPTNPICSLGATYGTWPKPPQGWVWNTSVYTGPGENLVLIDKSGVYDPYSNMYCGTYPGFSSYCGNSPHVGLCRVSGGYACARYNTARGIWE